MFYISLNFFRPFNNAKIIEIWKKTFIKKYPSFFINYYEIGNSVKAKKINFTLRPAH